MWLNGQKLANDLEAIEEEETNYDDEKMEDEASMYGKYGRTCKITYRYEGTYQGCNE